MGVGLVSRLVRRWGVRFSVMDGEEEKSVMMMTDGWTGGWMGCVKIWGFFFWFLVFV